MKTCGKGHEIAGKNAMTCRSGKTYCRACQYAATAAWAAKNPERLRVLKREAQARFRARHPERVAEIKRPHQRIHNHRRRVRATAAGGSHTLAQWLTLGWANGWKCAYCHERLTPETAEADHIVPVARGGNNDISNIAVSCSHCNRTKGAKTAEEFKRASL